MFNRKLRKLAEEFEAMPLEELRAIAQADEPDNKKAKAAWLLANEILDRRVSEIMRRQMED